MSLCEVCCNALLEIYYKVVSIEFISLPSTVAKVLLLQSCVWYIFQKYYYKSVYYECCKSIITKLCMIYVPKLLLQSCVW